MKIFLTTSLDCRQRFVTSAGKVYAFPGQDFKPLGAIIDSKKCRGIYTGPDIVDKLDCEPTPPGGGSVSDTSSGRSPMSPPSDPSVIIPPPVPACFDCDVKASFVSLGPEGLTVKIVNHSSCNLIFDATSEVDAIIITPNAGIPLPAGGEVPLLLTSDDCNYQIGIITVETDLCGDYSLFVGTVPPVPLCPP